MRHVRTTVLLLMLLPLLNVAPAFAEEEAPTPDTPKADEPAAEPKPEPKPEPDPEKPAYTIEYLMPGEDDESDDWKIRDSGAPAGSPTESVLEAMSAACGCGLDEDSFYIETSVYKKGDAKIAIAMVDVDKSVWAFRQKVDAAAKTHGWHVAEVGAKGRLLIVGAGEKQAEVIDVVTKQVIYKIGGIAMARLREGGREVAGREAAMAYAAVLGRVAPDTGIAYAVVGSVHWLKARQGKKRGEAPDAAEIDLCAAAWHKAFAKGMKYPPRKGVLVFCAGEFGSILLIKKDKSLLAEATRVLQIAVDHEMHGRRIDKRFNYRYDLGCCHARAGNIEEAFKMVRAALEISKSMKIKVFRPLFKHIDEKDPDMAPLRDDPRFSKLMADFKPPEKPKGHGNPHGKKGNPHK